jgi:GT2 family glycosyltransferase
MHVSIVVPTYRRPDLLSRCLAALCRQEFAQGEYEIIVADDAADEATKRLVESLTDGRQRIHYVAVAGRHGPAAARNVGWQKALGDIIAFTDDDCIPDSAWLARGIAPFADSSVIAVTGQTIVPLPPEPTDHERNTAGLETSEFITANCFVRRSALASVGGFDERFTAAWREDSDLHFRLLDTGCQIVRVSDAVVVHPVRKAAWGSSLREQRKAAFEALLFRKHPRYFRERVFPQRPLNYYAIVAAAIATIAAAIAGHAWLALAASVVWACLTLSFCWHRLRGASHEASHVAEMLVTSVAIPFLSVFWRLYGAWRYRVLFW